MRPPARPCKLRRAEGVLSGRRGPCATPELKRLAPIVARFGPLAITGTRPTSTVAPELKRLAPIARFRPFAITGARLAITVAPELERSAAELERFLLGQVEWRLVRDPFAELESY